jgi:hypothetical protein
VRATPWMATSPPLGPTSRQNDLAINLSSAEPAKAQIFGHQGPEAFPA